MGIKKGQELDLEITQIAFGGRGLVRVDGLAVFVDGAVPGDRVRARIGRKKKNYAEARVIEIVSPSPDRVPAPCAYSGVCGGCKWQFLDYSRQIEYKRQHVTESLAHIGQLDEVRVHPTLASERVLAYRNKMEFSCADHRWLMPAEMGTADVPRSFALGLHVPGTYHKVLDIQRCLLQPDTGNRILDHVRRYLQDSALPVYGLRSHVGFWRFVMLRHSVAHDRWLVNLVTAAEDRAAVQPLADGLMAAYPEIVAVVNNITARRAGVAVGEYEIGLSPVSVLRDRIGPYEFEISANSFFQTNTRGAARLYQVVQAYANLTGSETVLDLYSGTGSIAIYLAAGARRVVGLELAPSAVQDAEANCRRNDIANCRFVPGDVKEQLAHIDHVPDVMVIDPPRDGMHKSVTARVCDMAPPRLVYVSCNPATLARDLALLKERYHVLEVQPVDMFPHTFHIEAVARLERK